SDLWPRLERAASTEQGWFELYLDDERIWDLIALENGEELLKRCGLLAVDLLYGYEEIGHTPYPERLHPKIIQILLRREELPLQALMKFRQEPEFHRLLERNLAADTLSAALAQLMQAGPNFPQKLAQFARLNDKALADEVGPPPRGIITWIPLYYTVYEVPKKILQGRDTKADELFFAVTDPIFLAIDIASAGEAKIVRQALLAGSKELAEKAAEDLVKKNGRKFLSIILRETGLELASIQVGKEVAEKMSQGELVKWTVTGTLFETQRAVRSAMGKTAVVDITRPARFMSHYSGLDRKTVNRLTELNARLLMRGDGRVYVQLGNTSAAAMGPKSIAFFKHTLADIAFQATIDSEPGQKVIEDASKQAKAVAKEVRAWLKNISAWWLFNSSHDSMSSQQQDQAR
ncbi:MAG: hypothetical protein RML93_07555, partial [Anaerolineales bacterium]|nr:hypothetical protein [Anaerolineales bacterium]MDW8447129.1 hypothetical protein [Anaerolineales bacterium]